MHFHHDNICLGYFRRFFWLLSTSNVSCERYSRRNRSRAIMYQGAVLDFSLRAREPAALAAPDASLYRCQTRQKARQQGKWT
jgi:hypothetical protein